MWCQDTLYQRNNVGAVEDVKLGGVLGEDLGESKLLDCASSIIWRVEGDVGRCRGWDVGRWRLDGEETLSCCCPSLRRSEPQVNLEKIVGFRGRRGPCGRVFHGFGKLPAVGQAVRAEWKIQEPNSGNDRMKIEEAGMSRSRQADALSDPRVDGCGWIPMAGRQSSRCL